MSFDSSNNVLPIDEELIDKILVPAAKQFLSTEQYPISSLPMFDGVGVYAIYVDSGADTIYNGVLSDDYPVYVGKAVPSGSRQGKSTTAKKQLRDRLLEHKRSIDQGGLPVEYFKCRFMVMTGIGEDLIPALESTLIRMFHPLWNSYIDGFGIHTPGEGRLNQQPSEWDTLHPGRPWLHKLTGAPRDRNQIAEKIGSYRMR
ncbi:Eco29kI family restriction endonuclease [Halomonas sp. QHL1]|uniref:Eco29kI family restriction endonuclease n=1 Tax=Halomonas sp. QHL1 TaxID=1123773 RepID=UPI0008FD5866|nr:Eco29kI family restriction endonuclease [Halomonas sp. QHL1]OJA05314.1 Eco29kI family restriction endonuclease [Halomonas sp. QHL1]